MCLQETRRTNMGSAHSATLERAKATNAKAAFRGRFALVCGGTSGIGQAMAERLAAGGCNVTIVGRNAKVGNETVTRMKAANPEGQHAFIQSDLMLMSNCKAAVKQFTGAAPRLDFVVYCQTKATMQGRTLTPEGIDEKLSLNYYSRVYLTTLLLPLLTSTATTHNADVRVMSVLSAGVHASYKQYKEDPRLEQNYALKTAADIAGFYTDLAWDKFSRDNTSVTFVHAAPGFVSTNWGTDMNPVVKGSIRCMQAIGGRKASDCAEFMISGLVGETLRGGYRLIGEYGQPTIKTALHTDEAVDFVWKDTQSLLEKHY
jgi:NAD(P)-dependent dehydrogenase (short-subunit alcohol dehydrogenase family)